MKIFETALLLWTAILNKSVSLAIKQMPIFQGKKIWLYNHPDRLFRLYLLWRLDLLCSLCITDSEMVASLMLIILLPLQQARILPLLLGPWQQGCRGWARTGWGASTHHQGSCQHCHCHGRCWHRALWQHVCFLLALTMAMLVVSRLRLKCLRNYLMTTNKLVHTFILPREWMKIPWWTSDFA